MTTIVEAQTLTNEQEGFFTTEGTSENGIGFSIGGYYQTVGNLTITLEVCHGFYCDSIEAIPIPSGASSGPSIIPPPINYCLEQHPGYPLLINYSGDFYCVNEDTLLKLPKKNVVREEGKIVIVKDDVFSKFTGSTFKRTVTRVVIPLAMIGLLIYAFRRRRDKEWRREY